MNALLPSPATLAALAVNDLVNVEVDHLAKLIAREVDRRLQRGS